MRAIIGALLGLVWARITARKCHATSPLRFPCEKLDGHHGAHEAHDERGNRWVWKP